MREQGGLLVLVPAAEVIILGVLVYLALSYFWNTRAMDLLIGPVIIFSVYMLANWLHLPVIQRLMNSIINVAVIGLMVIFQPEIRQALAKFSFKGRKYREITEFDKFLDQISQSVYRLAERRIGAIIVMENQDNLDAIANKAVMVKAQFSSELLESIFITTTPLHDGAVIIRGTTVISAATILPLADDSSQLSKSMGTRHRAALGISQVSDALVIVISEETGKVSIARDGIMTRGIKIDRFKGIIRSVFTPPKSRFSPAFMH